MSKPSLTDKAHKTGVHKNHSAHLNSPHFPILVVQFPTFILTQQLEVLRDTGTYNPRPLTFSFLKRVFCVIKNNLVLVSEPGG